MNAEITDSQIATYCICCGKVIYLGHSYSGLDFFDPPVPRMCDGCKEVIRWAKEIKKLCADVERRSDDG